MEYKKRTIESCRAEWEATAKRFGWHTTPFFVQVWQDEDGNIIDSVSYKGMKEDIIIKVPNRKY